MKHLCLAAVLTLLVFNTTDCHQPGQKLSDANWR
jgi:hypothetical protein